jgi:hypothetical protein
MKLSMLYLKTYGEKLSSGQFQGTTQTHLTPTPRKTLKSKPKDNSALECFNQTLKYEWL